MRVVCLGGWTPASIEAALTPYGLADPRPGLLVMPTAEVVPAAEWLAQHGATDVLVVGPTLDDRSARILRDQGARDVLAWVSPTPEGIAARVAGALWRATPPADARFHDLVGSSPAMRAVVARARKVARFPLPTLITGESGTGKELLAQALHAESGRGGRFLPFNCAAIPEALAESELFGHAAGAFSGAKSARPGLLRSAGAGTVFLDEIGELPLPLQAKLLRVLAEKTVRAVGTDRAVPFDARLVFGTHRDLQSAVDEGTFRLDLLHRIRGVELRLPPLRQRPADIPLLARAFLEAFSREHGEDLRFPAGGIDTLVRRRWPGNVRELRMTIERSAIFAHAGVVDRAELAEVLPEAVGVPTVDVAIDPERDDLATVERRVRRHYVRAVDARHGRSAAAWDRAGVGRSTWYKHLREAGLLGGEAP